MHRGTYIYRERKGKRESNEERDIIEINYWLCIENGRLVNLKVASFLVTYYICSLLRWNTLFYLRRWLKSQISNAILWDLSDLLIQIFFQNLNMETKEWMKINEFQKKKHICKCLRFGKKLTFVHKILSLFVL